METLKQKYPEAYEEVVRSPIWNLWSTMGEDRKEEVLKGITWNQGAKQ